MINGKKIIVIMPAYNAEKTLKKTFNEIPHHIVDEIILTDDGSVDKTALISKRLGIKTFVHKKNKGYGANQKTCYKEALRCNADIIIMLHPDYQYNPRLITAMSSLIAEGIYDAVICSRILGTGALKGGMPLYKYIANRFLTFIENLMIGQKLSEYHTGYRAFSKKVIESLPILENSDDFVFDNQMLLQVFYFGFSVGEISCPTTYNKESSSINFTRSLKYGLGVLLTGLGYMIANSGKINIPIFNKNGKKINL
ncbi:MAG: glycosyl transferase family 2 [Candidatus Omnitrophica bacterium CG02_land_8_20_14_3_00__42_8]|nr:MAG: glycosyl transferase family 2 [Candidatus Omnitrophica bacterium CG02_land_8_20_14_3_00__42_8]PIW67592.1 MAG: glycosyl transferase family 2 [Candidatus Omnitrophica bacterium CG12_big_fil_rev_8_21_14_0_65_42_8]